MTWLPDGEKISKISLFVWTEYTNVAVRHMELWTLHDGTGHTYA